MFGRRAISTNEVPDEKLSALNLATNSVFGPSRRIDSCIDSSNPRMSDVIPTIDVIPMTMPSTVSADRILLTLNVSRAIAAVSLNSAKRAISVDIGLLASQSLDWIQHRCASSWIPAEEQSDEGGNHHTDDYRPGLHFRRNRSGRRDGGR